MLDIRFVRENPELVAEKSAQKGYQVDISKLLKLDEQRRQLNGEIDRLRETRNELSAQLKGRKPDAKELEKAQELKGQLATKEVSLKDIEAEFSAALKAVPNMPLADVPVGASEDENQVVKTVNELPKFDFEPKSHHQLGEEKGLIDKQRASKIAGSRFTYLRGGLVQLQFAIMQWVISELTNRSVIAKLIKENDLDISSQPFIPVIPPAMLRTEPYVASSRLDAAEVTYKIEQDDLWLNASAEHTLCTMYMDEILPTDQLPLRMLGYSTSFRREAGTYGKDMEGILRLHQFDKMEMEVLSTPESGLNEHKLMVAIQEYLVTKLGLPYQLLKKCTADIGKPNASGYDINCWFPAQQTYRETHTADYMGDYQTRDLKIRLRRAEGDLELVHTNDATAFAMSRILAAIMENFQQADGTISVPEVLQPFMGTDRI